MPPKKRKAVDDGGGGKRTKKDKTADVAAKGRSVVSSDKRKTKTTGISVHTKRITRGMTTDAPRQAVLQTTELIEQILLYLPMKQVFVVQRVCRQFRDIIAESTPIQKKLFLTLRGSERPPWALRRINLQADPIIPSFHYRLYDYYLAVAKDSQDGGDHDEPVQPGQLVPAHANPLLCRTERARESAERLFGQQGDELAFNVNLPLMSSGSWRNTYVSDPPCTSATLKLQWAISKSSRDRPLLYGNAPCGYHNAQADNPNGVKLGDLVDSCLRETTGDIWDGDDVPDAVREGSFEGVARWLQQTKKKPVVMDGSMSRLVLHNTVVPTKHEWDTVT